MAQSAEVSSRKRSKLDSFLKRYLPPEEYEQIGVLESCIISSEKEKKAIKFAVLTANKLYVTENPPKTIYEAANLKNIVDITLVNDIPEFLNGELWDSTQHFCLSVRVPSKRKQSRGRSKIEKDVNKLRATLEAHQNSNEQPGSVAVSHPKQNILDKLSASLSEVSFRLALRAPPQKPGKALGASMDEVQLKKAKSEMQDDETVEEVPKRKGSKPPLLVIDAAPTEPPNQTLSPLTPSYTSLSPVVTPATPSLSDGSVFSFDDTSRFSVSSRQSSVDKDDSHRSRSSSVQSETGFLNDDGNQQQTRLAELHLYILDKSSPFLIILRSTWNSCNIRSTLAMADSSTAIQHNIANSEHLAKQFSQISMDILHPDNTLEQQFNLLSELKVAAERNFLVKKQFWRSRELIDFIIDLLHQHINNLHIMDSMELSTLCIELLRDVIQDTYMISTRMSYLCDNKGAKIMSLIKAVCHIHISSHLSLQDADTQEVSVLQRELISAAIGLLYELHELCSHATKVETSSGECVNISWFVSFIAQQENVKAFLKSVLTLLFEILASCLGEAPSPDEAVLLLYVFTLLSDILDYSSGLEMELKTTYSVEFKYYAKPFVNNCQTLVKYPIKAQLLRLVDKVVHEVCR